MQMPSMRRAALFGRNKQEGENNPMSDISATITEYMNKVEAVLEKQQKLIELLEDKCAKQATVIKTLEELLGAANEAKRVLIARNLKLELERGNSENG